MITCNVVKKKKKKSAKSSTVPELSRALVNCNSEHSVSELLWMEMLLYQ